MTDQNWAFKQPRWIYWLFVIGISVFAVRMVSDSYFRSSAMLYIGVPFLVAVLVHQFLPRFPSERKSRRILNHLRDATVVMFATSAILLEGFLCVLLFLPIYWFVTLIILAAQVSQEREEKKAKLRAFIVPAFVLAMSLEGTTQSLSFNREHQITRSIIVAADVAELKANLAKPLTFDGQRNWFISLFPMPDRAITGSLQQGDIHKLHFTYRRWFFTNLQQGEMHIKLAQVSDNLIKTEIVRNDSYLSHYMQIDGTKLLFEPLNDRQTRVTLTVQYTRLLDPAWYFGPLQHYAVEKSADYLLKHVVDPNHGQKNGV
jgi:hypothetical protein